MLFTPDDREENQKPRPITIRSSADVIASLRSNLSEPTRVLIEALSCRTLAIHEIIAVLRQKCRHFAADSTNEAKVIIHLHGTKFQPRKNIFDYRHGLWFVKGTMADPDIQRLINFSSVVSSQLLVRGRHGLRNLVSAILQKRPLTLGQLVTEVSSHPQFKTAGLTKEIITRRVTNVLHQNPHFFRKIPDVRGVIPLRNARWSLVPSVDLARKERPKRPHGFPPQQLDAIYIIMMSKWRIRGWSLDELCTAVLQPDSNYKVKAGASREKIKSNLAETLVRDRCFARVSKEYRAGWRALWVGKLKAPVSPIDFNQLVTSVADDLGTPIGLKYLVENIKLYGSLFGWDASSLPALHLQRQVLNAVNSTKRKDITVNPAEFDFRVDVVAQKPKRRKEKEDDNPSKPPLSLRGDEGLDELLATLELPKAEEK